MLGGQLDKKTNTKRFDQNEYLLKGGCTIFGKLICFKGHLVMLYALYQILKNVLVRMFEFVFHFLLYGKIPLSKFDLISMISILKRSFMIP